MAIQTEEAQRPSRRGGDPWGGVETLTEAQASPKRRPHRSTETLAEVWRPLGRRGDPHRSAETLTEAHPMAAQLQQAPCVPVELDLNRKSVSARSRPAEPMVTVPGTSWVPEDVPGHL